MLLLFAKQECRVDIQGAAHRAGYRKCAGKQYGEGNRSKYEWVLRRGLENYVRKYLACGDTKQDSRD